MSLDSILRSGIALANSITADLQVTVTHEAFTGVDGYAKPTYASSNDYQALVEKRMRRFRNDDGDEVVSQYKVTFLTPVEANGTSGRSEPIDTRDRITLPDGATGSILHISGSLIDPVTLLPIYNVVYLGN